MTLRRCALGVAVAAAAGLASPAFAQLGAVRGALGGGVGQLLRAPGDLASQTLSALDPSSLLNLRTDRLDALVRAHPKSLERDDHGAPVVRGQVLAVTPTAQGLTDARRAGFDVMDPEGDADAGATDVVVLIAPAGVSARDAVKRLRKLDPAGTYDYNHLYLPAAERSSAGAAGPSPTSDTARAEGVRIGLVDTGVDEGHLVFSGARIVQRGFAKGAAAKPAAHGTEVASLLIGAAPLFHGAAPGAEIFVADVYGSDPAGGAADALVRALFWLAGRKVNVINISLVGPPNAALSAAVKVLTARGLLIVAAVGNDGPAAPPSYPASYPGVVAVTGVDARGAVLIEAGRAEHLDFAAPGADLAAASLSGGFTSVRGTSFAAPLVAGLLARLAAKAEDPSRSPLDALALQARHGRGYGRGLVAMDLRTPPMAVHAKADLAQ
jgi:subtilisin family serine protease